MQAELLQSHHIYQDTVWNKEIPQTELIIQSSIQEQERLNFEVARNKRFVQYELEFDINRYAELQKLKYILAPELYREKLAQAHEFTDIQLDTMLGERFNRSLSQIEYEIRDGKIYGKNADEPFQNVIKRGVLYSRMSGSSLEDQEREQAEVQEFENVEQILTNKDTPSGTMVVCVSLPGNESSRYKHNFYDVWTKMEDGSVQMSRYSSARTADEYRQKFSQIAGDMFPKNVNAMYFKKNQIVLNPITSGVTDHHDLHTFLHQRHELKDDSEMDVILKAIKHLQNRYKEGIAKNPLDSRLHEENFNLILHGAEMAVRELEAGRDTSAVLKKYSRDMDSNTAYVLAREHLETRLTPCGWSGRAGSNDLDATSGMSSLGPYTVASYGKEKWSYKTGQCRVCRVESAEVGPCDICRGCEKMFNE